MTSSTLSRAKVLVPSTRSTTSRASSRITVPLYGFPPSFRITLSAATAQGAVASARRPLTTARLCANLMVHLPVVERNPRRKVHGSSGSLVVCCHWGSAAASGLSMPLARRVGADPSGGRPDLRSVPDDRARRMRHAALPAHHGIATVMVMGGRPRRGRPVLTGHSGVERPSLREGLVPVNGAVWSARRYNHSPLRGSPASPARWAGRRHGRRTVLTGGHRAERRNATWRAR